MNHPDFGFAKIATAAFDVSIGDPMKNARQMTELARQAAGEHVDVLVFPELSFTGYTCADLFLSSSLWQETRQALAFFLAENEKIRRETRQDTLVIAGLPLRHMGRMYNVAAYIAGGEVLALVPKTFIPNYNEFYEKRWFTAPQDDTVVMVELADTLGCGSSEVPFGANIIVTWSHGLKVACEICEDLWVNCPPSSLHTAAGANLIVNPSASNDLLTKYEYRRQLVSGQSARCYCAYAYCSSGLGESTTDLVFYGHNIIASCGHIDREVKELCGLMSAVVDIEKLENDRVKFNSVAHRPLGGSYTVLRPQLTGETSFHLPEYVEAYPFVPHGTQERAMRCQEILSLQAHGLAGRLRKIGAKKVVIGMSGGLDSTLAFLVIKEAFDMLGLDMGNVVAITMPGFGTTSRTKNNAMNMVTLLGAQLRTIDITASCRQHMKDIGHPEDLYDVTYENVQARERTQILMDVANAEGALVIGTGDLSELALGWCTYNGDHMSMYAVNVSVPKTLVRFIVETYALNYRSEDAEHQKQVCDTLIDVCNTEISPELLPPDKNGNIQQKTEDTIGKYDLHDFFLYQFLRCGFEREKILALAKIAFPNVKPEAIENTLATFYRRFYTNQFKRSCLPDGPKIGTVSLSPRGDWRMPSDAAVK